VWSRCPHIEAPTSSATFQLDDRLDGDRFVLIGRGVGRARPAREDFGVAAAPIRLFAAVLAVATLASGTAVAATPPATKPGPSRPAGAAQPGVQQNEPPRTVAPVPFGGESDLAGIILAGLVAVVVLIVIPSQLAKGVARRRDLAKRLGPPRETIPTARRADTAADLGSVGDQRRIRPL
jgi:hypothetical protein